MKDCLFCKIIAGEIPSAKVYEDEDMIIIKDIEPKAKNHFCAYPKLTLNFFPKWEKRKPRL